MRVFRHNIVTHADDSRGVRRLAASVCDFVCVYRKSSIIINAPAFIRTICKYPPPPAFSGVPACESSSTVVVIV